MGALAANTVGDYSDALGGNGSLEKSLVHGVTQAGVAKLSGGDAKAALTASMTTELLSGWIGDQFKDTTGTAEGQANEKDKQAKLARVLGSLAGAIATNTAEGANSGATTGETIERYNRQLHTDEQLALEKLSNGDREKKARLLAAACYLVKCSHGLDNPTDDELATAAALESVGAAYTEEQQQLKAYTTYDSLTYPAGAVYQISNLFGYGKESIRQDEITDGNNAVNKYLAEQYSSDWKTWSGADVADMRNSLNAFTAAFVATRMLQQEQKLGSSATADLTAETQGMKSLLKGFDVAKNEKNLPVSFDGAYATKQLLGATKTPGGRDINFHAADRMVNPPKGRLQMTVDEVDQVLDGATNIRKRSYNLQGNTLTIQNRNMPGKPQVIVDEATGSRVITVIKSKRGR